MNSILDKVWVGAEEMSGTTG